MSSIGPSPPALPCCGCRTLSPGAAPGWRVWERGAPGWLRTRRWALPPGKETRSEGEPPAAGMAEKWEPPGDRDSPRSVLGHGQAPQGTTQAETTPGPPCSTDFKVAERSARRAAPSPLTPPELAAIQIPLRVLSIAEYSAVL